MSFGPTADTSKALGTLGTTSGYAGANAPNLFGSGTNYFQTLLNGNQNQTQALLQPDINRIKGAEQNTLQGISTLTPRGGGRDASLFSIPFAANTQIQNLFNPVRSNAASALTSAGSNLFGLGTTAATSQANISQQQQQFADQMRMAIAKMGLGAASNLFTGGAG